MLVLPECTIHTLFRTFASSFHAVKASPTYSCFFTPPLACLGYLHIASVCPLLPHVRHSATRNVQLSSYGSSGHNKSTLAFELPLLISELFSRSLEVPRPFFELE